MVVGVEGSLLDDEGVDDAWTGEEEVGDLLRGVEGGGDGEVGGEVEIELVHHFRDISRLHRSGGGEGSRRERE